MSADILTADGAAVVLTPPPAEVINQYNGPATYSYTPGGFAAIGGVTDEIVVSYTNSRGSVAASGYGLDGTSLFTDTVQPYSNYAAKPTVATLSGGGVVVGFTYGTGGSGDPGIASDFAMISADGQVGVSTRVPWPSEGTAVFVTPMADGFHVGWDYQNYYPGYSPGGQDYDAAGQRVGSATSGSPAFADTLVGGSEFIIRDNVAMLGGSAAIGMPSEPAHAMTQVTAAGLANGKTAAVAWVDSGTGHVSIYDATDNAFIGNITVDWGGVSDMHVVALPDGGFAVSWENGGAYKGEVFNYAGHGQVFDAAGSAGGVMSLSGQVGGIDSHGELYTVGTDANGNAVVQTYAINGSGGSTGGGSSSSVSTSDANYTAPDGVTSITLTGSNQTIHANNGGDTIFSDDTVNTIDGGTGNDSFHLGRGGDVVTGGGGNDTYVFAEMPWNGGAITDFNSGDVIDLSAMFGRYGYTGSTPVADGYLKITDDGQGDAQVWAQYATSGSNSGWWLVETLEGVSTANVTTSGDSVVWAGGSGSGGSGSSVSTSDANYTAPNGVTSITLTGSNQTIHANNGGDIIWSDDTHNTLFGGTGADTFHIGRSGDVVTGGGGADVFDYAQTPWGGSTITDFQSGDLIDLTGLMATTHDTGTDGFADGYLKIDSDGAGNAQVWANYNETGNDNWWLVTTLDGVSTSHLKTSGDTVVWNSNPGSGGGTSGGADTLTAKGGPVALGSGTATRGYTTVNGSDEVVVAYTYADRTDVMGYDLSGHQLFVLPEINTGMGSFLQSFSLASAGGAGFIMALTYENQNINGTAYDFGYQLINAAGQTISQNEGIAGESSLTAFSAQDGAHLEWDAVGYPAGSRDPSSYTYTAGDVSSGGVAGPTTTGGTGAAPVTLVPYANTQVGLAGDLVITDNSAQLGSRAAVTLPGEPAHALSDVAAAGLASGTTAAVAWVDLSTEHLSIYDASSNTFGANLTLDWGGASDTHVVALPDGGFVVSWMKGGAYYGEVFDAAGDGGGKMSLAGNVAGIDSAGDLYTVGLNSSGDYQVQTYAIGGAGGGASGGGSATVSTDAASYTAPSYVTSITLTGKQQHIDASATNGVTFHDDNGVANVMIGGAGNDTFYIGRDSNTVTGGAGADSFVFQETPWNGSAITDFSQSQGDSLDVSQLLTKMGYTGSDPFADHRLEWVDGQDGHGHVDVSDLYANYQQPGDSGWHLVVQLGGIDSSSLHYANGMFT